MNGSLFSCLILLYFLHIISAEMHTIAADQYIRDGETIVSTGEMFELGFFSPGNSKNRYLGIWYNNISPQTVVWVANRETPLNNTSGVFRVGGEGILQLLKDGDTVIWSSNSSLSIGNNIIPVAQILDNGNLIVRNESDIDHLNIIWQSFDYPCDHILPGMKFGKDFVTGRWTRLRSWKSLDDPSAGQYGTWIDTNGYPQAFQSQGSAIQYRLGPWNGIRFSGLPSNMPNKVYTYKVVSNEKEVYVQWELLNSSFRSRVYLSPDGNQVRLNWDPTQGWIPYVAIPVDLCAHYGVCGPYGVCSISNSPVCSCLDGFEPLHPEEWNAGNWSSGCRSKKLLGCVEGDGFQKRSGIKMPDSRQSWHNASMSLAECEIACKMNCSCTAYANLDIRNGGTGCLMWFGDLMDIRKYEENQDLHIRIVMTKPTDEESGSSNAKVIIVVVLTSVGIVLVCLTLAVYAHNKKKKSQRPGTLVKASVEYYTNGSRNKDVELPSFSLAKVAKYTNHFSVSNKLGEGGFGPVYKGVMENGQQIAVKRLSDTSKQGFDEFENEVRFVARLQHRNLVKLLGYCAQGNEIILIYEFMPNRSLDTILFDKTKNVILDWNRRFHIIQGIARGLLYLHQDSRLRIIHRDLKASNVLLDNDMNPKISDFGLARRFRGYESRAKTNNVVGTYGYMSPEYAVHGLYSVKSDVFSFGVLVLEIVSGMKNRGFSHHEHCDNLLGHAWRLYKDDKTLELVSASLRDSCTNPEVLRSIQIGLLCVQNHVEDRPEMSSVVLMFGNEGMLPSPKQPAFCSEMEPSSSSSKSGSGSVNDVTVTSLGAR